MAHDLRPGGAGPATIKLGELLVPALYGGALAQEVTAQTLQEISFSESLHVTCIISVLIFSINKLKSIIEMWFFICKTKKT